MRPPNTEPSTWLDGPSQLASSWSGSERTQFTTGCSPLSSHHQEVSRSNPEHDVGSGFDPGLTSDCLGKVSADPDTTLKIERRLVYIEDVLSLKVNYLNVISINKVHTSALHPLGAKTYLNPLEHLQSACLAIDLTTQDLSKTCKREVVSHGYWLSTWWYVPRRKIWEQPMRKIREPAFTSFFVIDVSLAGNNLR